LPELYAPRLTPYKDRKIKIGVRPEHLKMTLTANKNLSAIKARVEVIELMGNESYVYLQTEQSQVTVRTNEFSDMKPDSEIFFEPDYARMHFFDLETGNVIS